MPKDFVYCDECAYSAQNPEPNTTPECYLLPQVDKRSAICWAGGCFSGFKIRTVEEPE